MTSELTSDLISKNKSPKVRETAGC